jgi:hypothetical protein
MIASGGNLRHATDDEISALAKRDIMSWELKRLPGLGKEGLARFLADGGGPGATIPDGFLVTCTCSHLFLDELPAI